LGDALIEQQFDEIAHGEIVWLKCYKIFTVLSMRMLQIL
jgi:hypothetical protein